MRLCLMDFGRKYMNRIFIYTSVFFGVYLFYTVITVISYLGYVIVKFSAMINAIALFDVVVILTTVLIMLYLGAIANEQFTAHKMHLIKIKQTLLFIKQNL